MAADPRTPLGPAGPHWCTWVMGTGILAVAMATLPVAVPGSTTAARGLWALAVGLLAVVAVACARRGRALLADVALWPFVGAAPMALLTVATGGVVLGTLPGPVAVALWVAGTLLGLLTTAAAPRLLRGDPQPVWLLPVVPPMVSAATGPVVVPGLRAEALALFALAVVVVAVVGSRVLLHLRRTGPLPTAAVPTLFVVLGPLGQGSTAAHQLDLGVVVAGVLALAAATWLAVAAVATLAALRTGLDFSLAWWSFTFPLGTVVTATSGLAAETGWAGFTVAATVLLGALALVWTVVAGGTLRAARWSSARWSRRDGVPSRDHLIAAGRWSRDRR
ncbi:C4-dicarboxylate ABC transporter [Nocardioides litoris]|uniref:SLAC1 family transporter n=1 Tax=Nocardioides litoris TaxID=1926648 RepID=UPI001121DD2C|nr:C4-dicarboxylate ABC transporter [Nocardioides litoris]